MPTLRTEKSGRYTVRKPRGNRSRRRSSRKGSSKRRKRKETFPEWGDLAAKNERRKGRRNGGSFLETLSTARFGLLILAVAAGFTLYVGHVHATQNLLVEVQELRHDNLQLHLKHDRLKGEFDRMTGPASIYRRARALGLEESITYGPTIELE